MRPAHSTVLFSAILLAFRSSSGFAVIGDDAPYGKLIPVRSSENVDQFLARGEGMVIGGTPTHIKEHRYQVSLQVNGKHWCGGAIVADDVVLTSAFCMDRPLIAFTVRAGTSRYNKGGQTRTIDDVKKHPMYNPDSRDYDIAVVLLENPFLLGPNVRPVRIAMHASKYTDYIGKASGWGHVDGLGFTEKLQMVNMRMSKTRYCQKRYQPTTITPRMLCFIHAKRGNVRCLGDEGAPLVVKNRLVAIGINGKMCHPADFPMLSTDLTNKEIHSFLLDYIPRWLLEP